LTDISDDFVSSQVKDGRGLIMRLWRGEEPLGSTYWLYGTCVGLVIRLASPLITYLMVSNSDSLSPFDISAISNGWAAFVFAYAAFICVAIWRSANRYRVEKPAKKVNAGLAQVAVIFGFLATATSAAKFLSDDPLPPSSKTATADERLQEQAMIAGLNKNLPRRLDSSSTLTKIDYRDRTFTYFITVETAVGDKSAFSSNMTAQLRLSCKDAGLGPILKSDVALEYVYADAAGGNIADLAVRKADCPGL
jgi:hypothetical protein